MQELLVRSNTRARFNAGDALSGSRRVHWWCDRQRTLLFNTLFVHGEFLFNSGSLV
jgi:hypothetical protein